MKFCLFWGVILPALATTFLLSGCISDSTMSRSTLPSAWQTALAHPATSTSDFNGVYSSGSNYPPAQSFTQTELFSAGQMPLAPSGSTFELVVKNPDKIHIILRDGANILAQTEFNYTWDAGDHALVVRNGPKAAAVKTGDTAAAGITWKTARLTKGSDGALYMQLNSRAAMAFGFFFPVAESDEWWGRWEPVTEAARP